jgi:hypothetical protein
MLLSISKLTLGTNANAGTSITAMGLNFIAYSPIWLASHFMSWIMSWIGKPLQMAARTASVARAVRKRQGLLLTDLKRLLAADAAERSQTMLRIRYAMTYILFGRRLPESSEKK